MKYVVTIISRVDLGYKIAVISFSKNCRTPRECKIKATKCFVPKKPIFAQHKQMGNINPFF